MNNTMGNSKKIILDLCGGTEAWSAPYKEQGYDVRLITLPDYDVSAVRFGKNDIIFYGQTDTSLVENRIAYKDIYGILAAPPCTMFSLAWTTAKTPRDLDKGLELVRACLEIIWQVKPQFWAMENPKGLLRKFMGKPAFSFDASEFGCDYNKHTDLWGYFKEPRIEREYRRFPSTDKNTRKLLAIPKDYVRDTNMSTVAIKRSITPRGFAEAFYRANK